MDQGVSGDGFRRLCIEAEGTLLTFTAIVGGVGSADSQSESVKTDPGIGWQVSAGHGKAVPTPAVYLLPITSHRLTVNDQ